MINRNIGLFFLFFVWVESFSQNETRIKYNFNSQWKLLIDDPMKAQTIDFDDSGWKKVTIPYAWNEDEAFKERIDSLSTGIVWYRKHFRLPETDNGKKVFIEFEGIRQGGDLYLNGKLIGTHENGVMAFGFDISNEIQFGKENVLAFRIDNDWFYKEKATGSRFQWSYRNFNANYQIPLPKNMEKIQTWTSLEEDDDLKSFSGIGSYTTTFTLKKDFQEYVLKLDELYESAKIVINGQEAGFIWSLPYQLRIGKFLKDGENTITLEVANLMANRIRKMDKSGIVWRNYHEINFVNVNYKDFDASRWNIQPAGLGGDVKLLPISN